MTVQTSIQQLTSQSGRQGDLLAPHSSEAQAERDGNTTTADGGMGIFVVAILFLVTVFVAGFMRSRVERGVGRLFRRLADSAGNIDVPLILPLTIAETIREVFLERRVIAPTSTEQPTAN